MMGHKEKLKSGLEEGYKKISHDVSVSIYDWVPGLIVWLQTFFSSIYLFL